MLKLTRGTVTIDVDRCKGCELCIPACPPNVLSMSKRLNSVGYRYPELVAGCTGCTACQKVCPDYVFEVYKFDEAQQFEFNEVETTGATS